MALSQTPLVIDSSVQSKFVVAAPQQGHPEHFLGWPTPKTSEVLCKTIRVGLCGSDHRVWQGTMPAVQYPRVPGHEVVAQVIHDPLRKLTDKYVVVDPYQSCGQCYACRAGRANTCEHNQTLGVQRDGLLVRYFTIPRTKVLGLPVATREEAKLYHLTEPLAVANHVLQRAGPVAGKLCLVTGYGNIGRLVSKRLLAEGAQVLVVSHQLDHDLNSNNATGIATRIALSTGQIATLTNEGIMGYIDELTAEQGVTIAIETAGAGDMVALCLEATHTAGRVVLVGHSRETTEFYGSTVVFRELEILGSRNATRADFRQAIKLIQADPQWYRLPETHYPESQILEAFTRPHTGKVVIDYE